MHKICCEYAANIQNNMPKICKELAEYAHEYAWNMHKICIKHAVNMRIICTKYAEYAEYAHEYAENMHKIWIKYAVNMQNNMHKICRICRICKLICRKYAENIQKIF